MPKARRSCLTRRAASLTRRDQVPGPLSEAPLGPRRSKLLASMAWRIIVEAEGNEIRLVHKTHADTVVPALQSDATGEGVVAELRDADERPLYRQDVSSQFEPSVEVFSPEQI